MTLKQIRTTNIQTHKSVVIDLPKTGLVRFSGRNSNGKSVITKATLEIVRGGITRPSVRHSLINKESHYGEVIYTDYNDNVLKVHLERERNATYVEYTEKGQPPIQRYIADGTWKQLIHNFGFMYNDNRDVALQIVDDASPLLYLDTSDKLNGEILNTALTDENAETALEQFGIVVKEAREIMNKDSEKLNIYMASREDLLMWDTKPIEEELSFLEKAQNILENVHPTNLPYIPDMSPIDYIELPEISIPDVPDMSVVDYIDIPNLSLPDVPDMTPVDYIDLNPVTIPQINYPDIYVLEAVSIPDIIPIVHELEELKNRRCPTCGRPWVEDHIC